MSFRASPWPMCIHTRCCYDEVDAYVVTHSKRFKNYYIETGQIDGGDGYVLITDLTMAMKISHDGDAMTRFLKQARIDKENGLLKDE
jgi:hypothetical protein